MVVDLVQRKYPPGSFDRVRNKSADTVGKFSPQKVFDYVLFKIGPSRTCTAVKKKRPETDTFWMPRRRAFLNQLAIFVRADAIVLFKRP